MFEPGHEISLKLLNWVRQTVHTDIDRQTDRQYSFHNLCSGLNYGVLHNLKFVQCHKIRVDISCTTWITMVCIVLWNFMKIYNLHSVFNFTENVCWLLFLGIMFSDFLWRYTIYLLSYILQEMYAELQSKE